MSKTTLRPLPRSSTRSVSGWGLFPVAECAVYRPDDRDALSDLVARAPEASLIARGLGRSYGDAAVNEGQGIIESQRLGRMLDFDPESGILCCESAVSLAEILDVFLPRGFFFPVTPGTKFITVGGAIAADVHGKNHHHSGSMAASVLDFELLTARGEILRCSREENAEVFWATLGGMGLTGVILEARLRLLPVPSAYMSVDTARAADLDRVLELCAEGDDRYAYGVGWIDTQARGRSLGRSVLIRANHAELSELPEALRAAPYSAPPGFKPSVPFMLPNITLNPLSMRVFNFGIYHSQSPGHAIFGCERYFYPLDSVHHWNRIYGRRGMLQYQVVLPRESARAGLVEILESVANSRRGSFLTVIKSFGPASQGLLSFPRRGFTLSLDLPNTGPELHAAMRTLDRAVLRHGGRVYLAKDAVAEAEVFAEMYPELARFREIKAKLDPEQRFSSSLARRLGIVDRS